MTEDGISYRAVPGQDKKMIFKTTGNEHNELGRVKDTAPNRIVQMEKRMRKMDTILNKFPKPQIFGSQPSEADVTVFSWGSNKGIILDAMERLDSIKVCFVHVSHVWPFPTAFIKKVLSESKITVVAEQNFDGQFAQLIRTNCIEDVDHKILRYDGRPFDPIEIANSIAHIVNLKS